MPNGSDTMEVPIMVLMTEVMVCHLVCLAFGESDKPNTVETHVRSKRTAPSTKSPQLTVSGNNARRGSQVVRVKGTVWALIGNPAQGAVVFHLGV